MSSLFESMQRYSISLLINFLILFISSIFSIIILVISLPNNYITLLINLCLFGTLLSYYHVYYSLRTSSLTSSLLSSSSSSTIGIITRSTTVSIYERIKQYLQYIIPFCIPTQLEYTSTSIYHSSIISYLLLNVYIHYNHPYQYTELINYYDNSITVPLYENQSSLWYILLIYYILGLYIYLHIFTFIIRYTIESLLLTNNYNNTIFYKYLPWLPIATSYLPKHNQQITTASSRITKFTLGYYYIYTYYYPLVQRPSTTTTTSTSTIPKSNILVSSYNQLSLLFSVFIQYIQFYLTIYFGNNNNNNKIQYTKVNFPLSSLGLSIYSGLLSYILLHGKLGISNSSMYTINWFIYYGIFFIRILPLYIILIFIIYGIIHIIGYYLLRIVNTMDKKFNKNNPLSTMDHHE